MMQAGEATASSICYTPNLYPNMSKFQSLKIQPIRLLWGNGIVDFLGESAYEEITLLYERIEFGPRDGEKLIPIQVKNCRKNCA